MNFKGILVAGLGIFLVYIAVTGRYKDVYKALTYKGAN